MWKWKILSVLVLGLVGWVGMTMALTPTPSPSSGATPVWIDMTPTHVFLQSSTTAEMINEILGWAEGKNGPDWQDPGRQSVYEGRYTTSETAPQVLAAFQSAFNTGDWQTIPNPDVQRLSGFAESASLTTRFCYLQGHGTLSLYLQETAGEPIEVVALVNFPSPHYTCGVNVGSNISLPNAQKLPLLIAPEGVMLVSHSQNDASKGLLHSSHEDGMLFTSTRSLNEIAADYYDQLLAVGWQLVLEESTAGAAISTWNVPLADGSMWTGMMVFTADAEPDHYRAYIAMEPRP